MSRSGAPLSSPNDKDKEIDMRPGQSETWSTAHALNNELTSTIISSQRQTASLPLGRGTTRTYSSGDIVDKSYKLLSILGYGGMGVVFHCRHLILGKEYALKLLSADKLSADSWTRFQSEAKALARLHHPGVVGIHNMGIDDEQCPYYVMDLLQGESLAQIVKREGRLSRKRALNVFIQLCDALDSAHQQGIIHRDIKPSNVMLIEERDREQVKLVDFGIARLSSRGVATQNHTAAGTVFGTPFYMSPEQSLGQVVDNRSDIYSLGCTLFEALTGRPPHVGASAIETAMLHQSEETPSLNDVDPEGEYAEMLEAAVAKMLAKKPKDRYQSMKQVGHDLTRVLEGKGIGVAAVSPSDNSLQVRALQRVDEEAEEDEPQSKFAAPSVVLVAIAVSTLLLVLTASAMIFWVVKNHEPMRSSVAQGKAAATAAVASGTPDANSSSTDGKDTASSGTEGDPKEVSIHDESSTPDLEALKTHLNKNDSFVTRVDSNGTTIRRFHFPDYYMGYIQRGEGAFRKASGTIDVPVGEKVTLHLQCVCTPFPEVADRFGTNNVEGLEIVTYKPANIIKSVKNWTSLKHLSFFNSLEKAEGLDCSTLSTLDVPMLNSLTGLNSLGLSGEMNMTRPTYGLEIDGKSITRLKLLSTLQALHLKEIKDIGPLIAQLPKYPNLTEISLIGLDITDKDIENLSAARTIKKLTIVKCPRITPNAAASLKRMKSLKELVMDQKWPDDVKKKFVAMVPAYRYENYSRNYLR